MWLAAGARMGTVERDKNGGEAHVMTKSDLIDRIAEKLKLPRGKAEEVVNMVFESMENSLKQGERIEIRGFGSFEIRNYKAYEGRNPRTGNPVEVQPKRLPFFKVGKELKERVNNGRSAEDLASGNVPPVPSSSTSGQTGQIP